MITPPHNPHAADASAAMRDYKDGQVFAYHLTWPAKQAGVCCISGQWRRNDAGEVDAWYTADQLAEVLAIMQSQRCLYALAHKLNQ